MNDPMKVAVFVGSLRQASLSARLADALQRITPGSLALETVPIAALPLYNPDLESSVPESWLALRKAVRSADALLFITPEYNRSIPGALKNAIDVGSRPKEQNAWDGKPALVISLSQGSMGGFGAAHHLRQALVCLNVAVMPTPEVYLSFAHKLLDQAGNFTSPDTGEFLFATLASFATWMNRTAPIRSVGQA